MDYYQNSENNMQNMGEAQMDTESNGNAAIDATADAANGQNSQTKPYVKPWNRPNFVKRKKSEVRNFKLKKILCPKNAVASLNELHPNLDYKVEQESAGIGHPFCITVEVDGQVYKGYGSSKQLARQAAAEAALVSFVRPPTSKDVGTEDPDDKTPWATLASFAVYKLFNDWRDGRVGMCQPPPQPFGMSPAPHFQALTQHLHASEKVKQEPPQPKFVQPQFDQFHPEAPKASHRRAKTLPADAETMNPVMLLHQMRPEIVYSQVQQMKEGKNYFYLTGSVDDKTFNGEASNVKKAKYDLAVAAIQELFGVTTKYEPTK